jgi:membrane-associated phospholipid phosphatase
MRLGTLRGALAGLGALLWPSAVSAQMLRATEVPAAQDGALGSISTPAAAPATPTPSLWHPGWPRVRWSEVAIGGTLLAGTFSTLLWVKLPHEPRWTGGILMDDWVRDRLRANSPRGRRDAQTISTIAYYGLVGYAAVDPALAGLMHDWDTAGQMFGVNLLTMSVAAAPSVLLERTAGRQRPSLGNDSFPSGHTAMAFASALLTCLHHSHMPLYGGDGAEVANCAATLAAASTAGAARVVGDRHWTSDVLTGAAFGVTAGYLVPTLLHYGAGKPAAGDIAYSPRDSAAAHGSFYVDMGVRQVALGYLGWF